MLPSKKVNAKFCNKIILLSEKITLTLSAALQNASHMQDITSNTDRICFFQ